MRAAEGADQQPTKEQQQQQHRIVEGLRMAFNVNYLAEVTVAGTLTIYSEPTPLLRRSRSCQGWHKSARNRGHTAEGRHGTGATKTSPAAAKAPATSAGKAAPPAGSPAAKKSGPPVTRPSAAKAPTPASKSATTGK